MAVFLRNDPSFWPNADLSCVMSRTERNRSAPGRGKPERKEKRSGYEKAKMAEKRGKKAVGAVK